MSDQDYADDPALQDVRGWYIDGRRVHNPFASDAELVARFDAWLVEHDATVKREALGEATNELDDLSDLCHKESLHMPDERAANMHRRGAAFEHAASRLRARAVSVRGATEGGD